MKSRNKAGKAWLVLASAFLITTGASQSWGAAANYDGELNCQKTLTKTISKQASSILKSMTSCLLAGNTCPDVDTQSALDKAADKAFSAAVKKCQSTCSGVTALPCIANSTCPPNGTLPENCTGDSKNYFDAYGRMGFPGPYCDAIIGDKMLDPEDFGVCVSGVGAATPGLSQLIANELLENIYGDLASPPTGSALTCLSAILKAAPKTASKLAGTVSKCRNAQLGAEAQTVLPNFCDLDDPKTVSALAKTMLAFTDTVGASCQNADIAALDLCGGTATTVDDAKACLSQLLSESAYSTSNDRTYASISIINGAYPESSLPRCGDNQVNQVSNQFAFNGEECDGTDNTACPGHCLPPGDVFECTCDTIARARGYADGFAADLDNGWSGKSHNSKVTDLAGFVTDVTNCDCDLFDPLNPATCMPGHSSDPVCDVFAETQPRCSTHLGDGTKCDEVGNLDGGNDNADCQVCDDFAANAGEFCTGVDRFCFGGSQDGDRCNHASDCPGGSCSGIGRCIDGPNATLGCESNSNCSGVCNGGINVGLPCTANSGCPGSTCHTYTCVKEICIGGTNNGDTCDADADCPLGRCGGTSDCQSQCYPADNGPPTGPCAKQTDCDTEAGERCRGICDKTPTCVKLRNGAPLPLSANGTSVCVDSQFFTNITGTRNIYTGEHAINYDLRSLTILAGNNELNSRPCPVCGGYCEGTVSDSFRCEGTCTGPEKQCRFGKNIGDTCTTNADCLGELCGGVSCRFDDDCPSGTCSGTASPECATHGTTHNCNLRLACGGGTKPGQACRIEAYSAFGTTSSDCPLSGSNISGDGLAISWTPLTSGIVENEEPGACDAVGYENYDCNCVRGGGATRNQPNGCDPACTDPDPQYYGQACSALTTCVGGGAGIHGDGAACDEDSDCTSGDCSGNPRKCGAGSTGECSIRRCEGGTNPGTVCTQDAACLGSGAHCATATACEVGGAPCTEGECVAANCTTAGDCDNSATCDDACPNGRCTPLCLPRGKCSGGSRDGGFCAIDEQCTGGGTCMPDDPEEGSCANGAFNHCEGPGWEFKLCLPSDVNTQKSCAAGVNGVLGDADDNPGAGYCRADVSNCFINNGATEGGSTLNGKGDATNTYSVATFCIPASSSDAVNTTAGLPGPGRIRQPGYVTPNYTQLPIAP